MAAVRCDVVSSEINTTLREDVFSTIFLILSRNEWVRTINPFDPFVVTIDSKERISHTISGRNSLPDDYQTMTIESWESTVFLRLLE